MAEDVVGPEYLLWSDNRRLGCEYHAENMVNASHYVSVTAVDKLCKLSDDLAKAKTEIRDKEEEIVHLKDRSKQAETALEKHKADIRVLKSHTGNLKKEVRTLTTDRDDAIREKEQNFREMSHQRILQQQRTEENHLLCVKVESLNYN